MRAKLRDMVFDRNGNAVISFETAENFRDEFDELYEGEVEIEIKKWRKKRSLDANAYCWVLINKLAEKLGKSRDEVYREAIRSIGGVSDVICVREKAADALIAGWQHNGTGWQAEMMESKIKGCVNVILYYGSSVYDTKQMAALIDHIVQDCEAVGIPTMTDEQIEEMMRGWRK